MLPYPILPMNERREDIVFGQIGSPVPWRWRNRHPSKCRQHNTLLYTRVGTL